jgi:DNA-binding MarR family transcriptional regulator
MSVTISRPELIEDGDDAPFRQMIHDALGFSTRLLEIRNRLGEVIGLSGPAFSILIAIEHLSKDADVGISQVSEHLHQSGAFVTLEVAKLVKAGLVDKFANPEDGRRVIVKVTDKARALLAELAETQRPVNDAIFAGLDAEQFRAFAAIAARLVSGTEESLALLRYKAEQRRSRA